MGRGQTKGSSDCNKVYAKVALMSGDDYDPRFELTIPNPDFGVVDGADKTINDGREPGLYGKIVYVSAKEDSYKGEKNVQGKILLEDIEANEIYYIQFGQSSVARNLINSLAAINKPGVIELGLYTNKKGYATISVTNNGDRTEWMWHPGENDPKNEYTEKIDWVHDPKKDKEVPNYWKLDKWLFLDVLGKDIAARVKAARDEDPVEETKEEIAEVIQMEEETPVVTEAEVIEETKVAPKGKTAKGKAKPKPKAKNKEDDLTDDLPF